MLFRGGQPSHQFGLQLGVWVAFRRRYDDVVYFRGVTLVQLRDHVAELLMPAKVNCASAWANHTAGRSAQNSGSRTATLDISAGIGLFVVPLRSSSFL
jgi:hypothetical protein